MKSLADQSHRHDEAVRHRELLSRTDQGFCVLEILYDADGRPADYCFLEANSAFERHTGLVDPVGKRARELVPNLEPHWVEAYARVVEEGTPLRFEQGSDAMGRWFAVEAVRVGDERGRQVALLFTDISERRRAESALRANEEQVRAVLESISDAFFALDGSWRFTYVNRQAEQILDRRRDELLGAVIWSSYPGLHGSAFERAYRQAMDSGVASSVTAYYPDHERWYEVHAYPAPTGITVYFRDATAPTLAQQALRASELRFRQLADTMPQIAWVAPGDGSGLDYLNAQWQAYTGMSAEESLRDPNQAIHPDDRGAAEAAWVEALRTQQPYEFEMRLRRADGAYRWFLTRCVPQRNEAGDVDAWLGTSTDIHERHEAARSARFLADLAETIRNATDEGALLGQVAAAIGAQLQVRRCLIIDIDTVGDRAVVRHDYSSELPPVPREYRVSDYSAATRAEMEHGRPIVNHDVARDPRTAALFATTYQPYGDCAYLAMPLMREGRWEGTLWVSDDRPRVWQAHEIALLETAAERLWLAVEKLRLDAHLRESEANFRALADNMAQLAWMADAGGAIGWYNRRWYDYTGATLAEAQRWGWPDLHHPAHVERVAARIRRSQETGEPWEDTFPLRGRDGEFRWFLSRAEPIRDPHGRILRWFGTHTDIHESETREQDARFLAELSERVRLADDDTALEADVMRATATYLQTTRCFFAEVFLDEDRWVVRHDEHGPLFSIVGDYPLSAYDAGARREMAAGRVLVMDDARTDPRAASVYATAYEPLAVRGHVVVPLLRDTVWVSMLIVTSDQPRAWQAREVALLETIAERTWNAIEKLRALAALEASEARLQQLYAQEQAARAAAEEASRLKDEFLATVSHELRTPLTSLLGYLYLLQSRPRDAEYVARTLEKAARSAQAQAQLTDDLLDVSRIISGKLRVEPRPMSLASAALAALDTVRPAIDAKGITLQVALDPEASGVVGDPGRLQQVIWNLLANAAKFTPAGGEIQLQLARQGAHAQLSVRDTGQGIRPDFLPFVFDRFRQADGTSTRSHGGLGLGLAIVRHLVELHGGTVTAASDGEGHGATFTLRLPLAAVDDAGPAGPASQAAGTSADYPAELRGLRIMVVDDQPAILELLRELLELGGAHVETLTNAREALERLRVAPPDLLISDIAMPEFDGYWLIRSLRDLPASEGGAVPALALTAYVRDEERARVLAAGFQQYVPKPVDLDELLAAVAALVRP